MEPCGIPEAHFFFFTRTQLQGGATGGSLEGRSGHTRTGSRRHRFIMANEGGWSFRANAHDENRIVPGRNILY